MRNKFSLLLALVLLVSGARVARAEPAAERPLTFTELWNNVSYYDTNVEKKGFASLLGRFEGKIGYNLLNSPLQAYGVYYTAMSQSPDYWDNSLFAGIGARYKPFESYQSAGWQDAWVGNLKIFVESLSASYYKDAASAEAAGLKKTDLRVGLDLWQEWNLDNPDEQLPWGELWTNLSWRSTNFTTAESNNPILYFQPKIGRHLGKGVELYLRGDLTYSVGNEYWLNVADYGVGVRIEPWRAAPAASDLFKKFKMFVEVLGVSYLKDKPTDPNKEVTSDVRFGIDFSYGR